jgi:hypothetical protein
MSDIDKSDSQQNASSSSSSNEKVPDNSQGYTATGTLPIESDGDKVKLPLSNEYLNIKSARLVGDVAQFVGKSTRIIARRGSGYFCILDEMYRQMQAAGVDEFIVIGSPVRSWDDTLFTRFCKTKMLGKKNIGTVCKWVLDQATSGKQVAIVFYNCFGSLYSALGRHPHIKDIFSGNNAHRITSIVLDEMMVLGHFAHYIFQFDRVLFALENYECLRRRIYKSLLISKLTFEEFTNVMFKYNNFTFLMLAGKATTAELYWYKPDLQNQQLDNLIPSSYVPPQVKPVNQSQLEVLEEISTKLSKLIELAEHSNNKK